MREMRSTCPTCNGDLVGTRSGAVCMNASLGKCSSAKVMPYTVPADDFEEAAINVPVAEAAGTMAVWMIGGTPYRRDARAARIAWKDGAKLARSAESGRVIALQPLTSE